MTDAGAARPAGAGRQLRRTGAVLVDRRLHADAVLVARRRDARRCRWAGAAGRHARGDDAGAAAAEAVEAAELARRGWRIGEVGTEVGPRGTAAGDVADLTRVARIECAVGVGDAADDAAV